MSLLKENVRNDFEWALRAALLEKCKISTVLSEGVNHAIATNFVKEEATYEQLLNLAFNPGRDEKYVSGNILESAIILSFGKAFGIPFVKESEEKTDVDEVVSDIKGDEETVATAMDKVKPEDRDDVLASLRKEGETYDTVDSKMKLLEKVLTVPQRKVVAEKVKQPTVKAPINKKVMDAITEAKSSIKKWVDNNQDASKKIASGILSETAILVESYFVFKRLQSKMPKRKAMELTLESLNTGKQLTKDPTRVELFESQISRWTRRLEKIK